MKALSIPITNIILFLRSLCVMASQELLEPLNEVNAKYIVKHISYEDNETGYVEIIDSNGVCKEAIVDKDDIRKENIAIGSSVCFVSGKMKNMLENN